MVAISWFSLLLLALAGDEKFRATVSSVRNGDFVEVVYGAIARGRTILTVEVDEEIFAAARVRLRRDLLADLMVAMKTMELSKVVGISNPISVLNLHCNCRQNVIYLCGVD